MRFLQSVTALLLTSAGAGTALPPPSLERRWWSVLSCHTDNYQHTASWGYTTGMEGQIALACGVMIGHSGSPQWIAGGGTLLVSVPLPAGGHATHIQVSFVARGAGVLLGKATCADMLRVVLSKCAVAAAAGQKAGKLHGGYVRTADGRLAAMMAFFPTCCHRGTDTEHENDRAGPRPDSRDWD